jgi:hypothetical protein
LIRRRVACLTWLALALAAPAIARADDSEAERLFREARKLVDAGDYAAACPKFAESERLEPAPGTLVNLAECEEHTGKVIAAQEHYRLASSGYPKTDKRHDLAAQKATALDGKIVHLTVRLGPGAPSGVTVRRGDAVVAEKDLGVAVAVDPGALAVVVTAPGRVDKSYPLTLHEGETKELVVVAGEALPVGEPKGPVGPVGAPEKPVEGGASPLRTIGFVVGGVGVAGLALGAVTGILAMGSASTVRSHCNTTTYACDPQGLDAARTGDVLAPLSTVGFIAGGVLVTTGLVLVLVGGKKKEAVSFVPVVGPTFAQAAFVGRF